MIRGSDAVLPIDSGSVPRAFDKLLGEARRSGVRLNVSGTFNGEAWLEVFARQKRDRQSALRLSRFFGVPTRVNGQHVEETYADGN